MNDKFNSVPPTDEGAIAKINFDTITEYKIGKTIYRITSYYKENGEPLTEKIVQLLKQDLNF